MKKESFEKLVQKAISSLPQNIQEKMKNLAIVIEKNPQPGETRKLQKGKNQLLGLYQGVPQTTWGKNFGQVLPDKITIFQEPIENLASEQKEVAELVKLVVWHEIAHYFGFKEEKIKKLEEKWQKKLMK